ncbi:MAG: hypothetical protein RLY31_809 [Bacteroidota bacterium]
MLWNDIIRTALLGTDQTVLPVSVRTLLREHGLEGGQDPPARLLAMAAVLERQLSRAGVRPGALSSSDMPTPPPADAEALRPFPTDALPLVGRVLEGGDDILLPSLMSRMEAGGYAFPAEYLPLLLMRPDADDKFGWLFRRLDAVGKWLLRQHPEWRFLLMPPPAEKGSLSALSYRRSVRYFRLTDASAAREQALREWSAYSPVEKKEWLSQLIHGYSDDDRVLLLRGLADSRKEVRQAAGALQASAYAGSGDVKGWESRGRSIWRTDQGRIDILIPGKEIREQDRAQLAWDDTDWPGGEQAVYLGLVLSKVPPGSWERHLGWPPAVIVDRILTCQWGNVIFPALLMAAATFRDPVWQQLLLRRLFDMDEGYDGWYHPAVTYFLRELPAAMAMAQAHDYLADRSGLPDENNPVFRLLFREPTVWDQRLSVLVGRRLQQSFGAYPGARKCTRFDRRLLRWLGGCSLPQVLPVLADGWPDAYGLPPVWKKEIHRMLRTVRLHQVLMELLPVPLTGR